MSQTPLAIDTLPGITPPVHRIVLTCSHGTTRAHYHVPPGGYPLTEAMAIRAVLACHFHEEQCSCVRKLWQEHFGTSLGELPLAVGAP